MIARSVPVGRELVLALRLRDPHLPSFLDEFILAGLVRKGEPFL